jgi:hypothetical protein
MIGESNFSDRDAGSLYELLGRATSDLNYSSWPIRSTVAVHAKGNNSERLVEELGFARKLAEERYLIIQDMDAMIKERDWKLSELKRLDPVRRIKRLLHSLPMLK